MKPVDVREPRIALTPSPGPRRYECTRTTVRFHRAFATLAYILAVGLTVTFAVVAVVTRNPYFLTGCVNAGWCWVGHDNMKAAGNLSLVIDHEETTLHRDA